MAIVVREKKKQEPIRIGRRPILSASSSGSDPTSTPFSAALEQTAESGIGNVPFGLDGRPGVTHGLHVESVEHEADAAKNKETYLKPAEFSFVDKLSDIDSGGSCHDGIEKRAARKLPSAGISIHSMLRG